MRHRFLLLDEQGRLHAAEIDDVRSIHVKRRPVPANCVAIADQSETRSLLFLDIPGVGGKIPTAQLRLVDDVSLELLSTLPLRATEYPLSAVSSALYHLPAPPADEQVPFFVIGTAFVLPSESEPTNGRLLVCRVEKEPSRLVVVAEQSFDGGCMAVAVFKGKIVVGVNSEIHLLDFDPASLALQTLCKKAEDVCVTCLSVDEASETLAVGDILRSVAIYKITVECLCGRQLAQMELVASELVRRNVTAMERLPEDSQRLAVCDAYGNLSIMGVVEDKEIDRSNPQKRVVPLEWMHLDDQINRFVVGSLFRNSGQKHGQARALAEEEHTESAIQFNMVFCTVSGRIGLIGAVGEEEYAILRALEDALDTVGTGESCHVDDHAGGRTEPRAVATQRDAVHDEGDGVLYRRRYGGAVFGSEHGREGGGRREGECCDESAVHREGNDGLRAGYSDQALVCLLNTVL